MFFYILHQAIDSTLGQSIHRSAADISAVTDVLLTYKIIKLSSSSYDFILLYNKGDFIFQRRMVH